MRGRQERMPPPPLPHSHTHNTQLFYFRYCQRYHVFCLLLVYYNLLMQQLSDTARTIKERAASPLPRHKTEHTHTRARAAVNKLYQAIYNRDIAVIYSYSSTTTTHYSLYFFVFVTSRGVCGLFACTCAHACRHMHAVLPHAAHIDISYDMTYNIRL